LRWQTKNAWECLETTTSDVTEEQANWQPAGTANPIGANYAHLMITADAGFNTQLFGGMPLMATKFKGQIGLSEMPHAAGGWHDWLARLAGTTGAASASTGPVCASMARRSASAWRATSTR
jgi:hypothetical protein